MDITDEVEAIAEAAANGAKQDRDLKAVSVDMLKKASRAELVMEKGFENPSDITCRKG